LLYVLLASLVSKRTGYKRKREMIVSWEQQPWLWSSLTSRSGGKQNNFFTRGFKEIVLSFIPASFWGTMLG